MPYSFEKVYQLKQQTPLLHFQHDQAGATLRATEVKPKLDRYLLKLLCKREPQLSQATLYEQLRKKGWMAQKTEALRYQMQIFAEGKCRKSNTIQLDAEAKEMAAQERNGSVGTARKQLLKENPERYTKINAMYFGNMVNERQSVASFQAEIVERYKETVWYSSITLQIRCFIPDLLQLIDEQIKAFFVLHNFGCRQSKGFGGFLIDGTTPREIRESLSADGEPYLCARLPDRGIDSAMNHAMTLYAVMKSGLNLTKQDHEGETEANARYIKGYALRDFLTESTGSDKAYMKSSILFVPENRRTREKNHGCYPSYVFIRALLGLADHYEFRFKECRQQTVHVLQYDSARIENGTLKIDLEDIKNNRGIHRLQSPLLIKVYMDRVYFIMTPGYQEALGKIFLLLNEQEYKKIDALRSERTPDYTEIQNTLQSAHYLAAPTDFDAAGFLRGFKDYFDKKKQRLANFGRYSVYYPSKDVTWEEVGESDE